MSSISINTLLLLIIFIPFFMALLLFGVKKWITNFAGELAVGVLIILIGMNSALINWVKNSPNQIIYGFYETSEGIEYGAPIGVQFRLDSFTSLFLLLINILLTIILIYETGKKRGITSSPTFFSLLLFSVTGINVIIISNDFFTLVLGWIILSISLIFLFTFKQNEEAIKEGGIRSYITYGLSISLLLLALILSYGLFGTLNFDYIYNHPEIMMEKINSALMLYYLDIALIIVSFGLFAQFIFLNLWVQNTIKNAEIGVKIIINGLIGGVSLVSLFRVLFNLFNPLLFHNFQYPVILSIIGILTAFEGAFLVLYQFLHKQGNISLLKIITYSTIANMGMILTSFSLGAFTSNGTQLPITIIQNSFGGSVINILNLAFTIVVFHFAQEKYSQFCEEDNLVKMKGLGKVFPYTTFAFIVALFSNSGIIPTVGGLIKFILIRNFAQANVLIFAILIGFTTLLLFSCYLWIIKHILFDKSDRIIEMDRTNHDLSIASFLGVFISLALLLFGFFPSIFVNVMINGISILIP